ncbi:MAG TPA: two-component regulator propeller domain-containing protein [Blastocatellia bacterium]
MNPIEPATGRSRRSLSRGLLLRLGLLVPVLFLAEIEAQAGYRFDHWTTDNGLPNNSVHGIVQTRDGYLWLTTNDGLVRFDGVKFSIYTKANSEGIPGNRFQLLYEDSKGALWASLTLGGITRYKNGSFTTYTRDKGLPDDRIWDVREGSSGDVLILTNHGIFKQAGNEWIQYGSPDGIYKAGTPFDAPYLRSGLSFADGGGLRVFKGWGYGTVRLPGSIEVRSAYESHSGQLWIWSKDGTLYNVTDGSFKEYPLKEYAGRDLSCVEEDTDGGLWVSIWDTGLVRLKDGESKLFSSADGMASKEIYMMVKDAEGYIWLASETDGLYRIRNAAVTTISESDGLASNNVYPICEDLNGTIWVGSGGKGLNRIKNGVVTPGPPGLTSGEKIITAICADRDGYIWIGTYEGVLRFKEGLTAGFEKPPGLPFRLAFAITQDRDGVIWIGAAEGLTRYMDGVATTYQTDPFEPSSESRAIINIFEDTDGNLWLGAFLSGLIKFRNGVMTRYTEREGLPSNHVRAIYQDHQGIMWFGTYDGGLVRLKDGKLTTITPKDGLFSAGVFQILEDGRGYFWMSSNQGIYRAASRELNDFADGKVRSVTCVAYGKADGMLNAECNGGREPAGCKDRAGRLWFPTQEGVAVIDPASLPMNDTGPPVLIEAISVNHIPSPPGDTLRVYPGQDELEITYTALSFVDSDKIRFRYKLEGLDQDWNDSGTRRTAYLSRVPPGSYTFRVIAANSDGVWNNVGATMRLIVVPPFYRTGWFFTVSSLAIIAVAFLAYKRRIAGLEKARRIQEAFSKQLIDYQEQERKRIAAELHDGLSQSLVVIKNRAAMAQGQTDDPEGLAEQLEEIGSSASEAIDEVREIAHNLRPVLLDRLGLTKAVESMLRRVGSANKTEFAYEIAPLEGVFPKDSEVNFYRIIQEAVNNIIKHSGASEANIRVLKTDGILSVNIIDNGKGFDTAEAARTGGFGLIGITERARILRGETEIRSVPGSGTTVQIKFKLHGERNGR